MVYSETMTQTATTARVISFGVVGRDTVVRDIRSFPIGTEVYVSHVRGHRAKVRVPGTLYTQIVTRALARRSPAETEES